MRIDEPIQAKTTTTGGLIRFTARGSCYQVRKVLGEPHAAGELKLFRLQVEAPSGPAVAEVIGPADPSAEGGPPSWKLCQVWI